MIANFIMEDFKEVALSRAAYKPTCWFHYVDNTFMIWPHKPEELNDFLNNIHPNVQFTMHTELNSHLSFLDTDIYRRQDGYPSTLFTGSPPTSTTI
jgi:hypothetical protein